MRYSTNNYTITGIFVGYSISNTQNSAFNETKIQEQSIFSSETRYLGYREKYLH